MKHIQDAIASCRHILKSRKGHTAVSANSRPTAPLLQLMGKALSRVSIRHFVIPVICCITRTENKRYCA